MVIRHLANRLFALVVHGDAAGAETLRRSLADWLTDMELLPAALAAIVDRYIGYYEPYATSHDALDKDTALHEEVRNAALAHRRRRTAARGDSVRGQTAAWRDGVRNDATRPPRIPARTATRTDRPECRRTCDACARRLFADPET